MSTSKVRQRNMSAAWRHVDPLLLVFTIAAVVFGAFLIHSTTSHREWQADLLGKQVLFATIGIGVMMAVAAIDYAKYGHWVRVIYGGSIVALVLVLTPLGTEIRNIQAWFDFGGFTVQPSEAAKLGAIIGAAYYLAHLEEVGMREALIAIGIFAVPSGLIMLQPDLGTMLVFLFILVMMLLSAKIPLRYLVSLLFVGILMVFGVLSSGTLEDYQQERLTSFLNSDPTTASARRASYNTRQAQQAIALGGLTGEGYLQGEQTKGGYVPEQQTDFIFTVAGEELGFRGSALLIALLGGVIWRIWRIAQMSRDRLGAMMCLGVLAMFMFHIFENIGMNLGIMPVTGIPLPFVSYGGSSMVVWFACIGLVLNVHMRRFT